MDFVVAVGADSTSTASNKHKKNYKFLQLQLNILVAWEKIV